MPNSVDIANEKLYYHTNMNLLVFHVDITSIKEYMNFQKINEKHNNDIKSLKENMNFQKFNDKKIIFMNRLKYAEQKTICICREVYQLYEGKDYDKIYEVLSTLKNKKLKINKNLTEKYKDMFKNPELEQDYWSIAAIGVYKIGHDSFRLMKCLGYYDRRFL